MALCCFYSGVGRLNSIRSSMYLLQDAEANQFRHASCVPHVRFRLGQHRNLPTIRPHPFHPAMPHNDFDGASIATQQSASTIASTFSTIWSKVPSSRGKIALSLDDLCSYLRATTDVEHSPIEELIIRKEEGDRKSTRLNSSHQIISYAVFCLKKKKISTSSPYTRHRLANHSDHISQ